ncbi:uncharacterized protein LOC135806404 [Sycon ciliatum]|uniref:uncharacterized protein LOC135806404 n=1 Tax=Sycon ciliatum TaxID=27933 RepID=UPI0031F6F4CA
MEQVKHGLPNRSHVITVQQKGKSSGITPSHLTVGGQHLLQSALATHYRRVASAKCVVDCGLPAGHLMSVRVQERLMKQLREEETKSLQYDHGHSRQSQRTQRTGTSTIHPAGAQEHPRVDGKQKSHSQHRRSHEVTRTHALATCEAITTHSKHSSKELPGSGMTHASTSRFDSAGQRKPATSTAKKSVSKSTPAQPNGSRFHGQAWKSVGGTSTFSDVTGAIRPASHVPVPAPYRQDNQLKVDKTRTVAGRVQSRQAQLPSRSSPLSNPPVKQSPTGGKQQGISQSQSRHASQPGACEGGEDHDGNASTGEHDSGSCSDDDHDDSGDVESLTSTRSAARAKLSAHTDDRDSTATEDSMDESSGDSTEEDKDSDGCAEDELHASSAGKHGGGHDSGQVAEPNDEHPPAGNIEEADADAPSVMLSTQMQESCTKPNRRMKDAASSAGAGCEEDLPIKSNQPSIKETDNDAASAQSLNQPASTDASNVHSKRKVESADSILLGYRQQTSSSSHTTRHHNDSSHFPIPQNLDPLWQPGREFGRSYQQRDALTGHREHAATRSSMANLEPRHIQGSSDASQSKENVLLAFISTITQEIVQRGTTTQTVIEQICRRHMDNNPYNLPQEDMSVEIDKLLASLTS